MTAKKIARKIANTSAKKGTTKVARKAAASGAKTSDAVGTATDLIAGPPKAFPPGMSNPATRALANIGVTRLSQLTLHREESIAALHGMGPNGVKALEAGLKLRGKSFRA